MTQLASLAYAPVVDAGQAVAGLNQISTAAERMGATVFEADQRVTRSTASFDAIERRAVRFGETTEAAVRRIEIATASHTRAMEAATRAAQQEGISQDRLKTTLDSLGRARDAAAQRAVSSMKAEEQQAALTAAGYARLYRAAANDNTPSVGGGLQTMRGQLANIGFQLQDVAIQAQMGTNALTILAQQGSQVLGGFGAAGALAGTALAFGAIAAQVIGLADNTDRLKVAMDAQKASWDQATDSAEVYRKGLVDQGEDLQKLAGYYASLTESVRVFEERRLEAGQRAIADQRDQIQRDIVSPAGGLLQSGGADMRPSFDPLGNFQGYEQSVVALTDRTRKLVDVIQAFRDAGPPTQQSIAELDNRLRDMAVGSDAAAAAARGVIEQIRAKYGAVIDSAKADEQASGQLAALRGNLDQTGGAAAGTARNVSDLVAQVLNLKQASAETTLGPLRENLANLDAQVEAARKGTAALAQVRREQQAQAQADQALERAVKAEAERLGKTLSPEDAAPRLEEFRNETRELVDAARQRTLQVAQLEDQARERETAARKTARAAATAARKEERQEERDAKKAQRDLERENADALKDRQKLIQENETAYERYQRKLEEVAVLQDRADKAGSPIDPETVRRQTDALMAELDRAGEHADDMRAKDAERAEKQQDRLANRQERVFDQVVDRYSADLSRGIVDAIFDGTKDGESFFEILAKTFSNMLRTAVTSALDAMVIRPLIGSLVEGLGFGMGGGAGGLGMGGAALAGGGLLTRLFGPSTLEGGAYNIGSLGRAFTGGQVGTGFGGVDRALNAQAYSGIGGVPVSYGNALAGGLGIGAGAYGLYSGIQKGGVGGFLGGAGGALSAGLGAATMAGLAVPGYGWAAAAILGVLGAMLPGQKPSNKEGTAFLTLADDSLRITGQEGKKFSQENRDQASGIARSIGGLIDKAEAMLNFRATQVVEVGVGNRDGIELRYGGSESTYKRDEEGAKALTRDIVQRVVMDNSGMMAEAVRTALGGIQWGDVEAALRQMTQLAEATNGGRASANQNIAARNIDWSNFEQGIADLTWVRDVYDQIQKTSEATSEWSKQMEELRAKHQGNIDTARRLGLATDAVSDAWRRAVDELVAAREEMFRAQDFDLQVRAARASGNAYTADMVAFNAQATQELRDAQKEFFNLGLTAEQSAARLAQIEIVLALEREQINATHLQAQIQAEQRAAAEIEAAAQAAAQAQIQAAQEAQRAAEEAARAQIQAAQNARQRMYEEIDMQARVARAQGLDQYADTLSFNAAADRELNDAVDQWTAMGLTAEEVSTRLRWLQETQSAERLAMERRHHEQSVEQARQAAEQKLAEERRGNETARNVLEQLAVGELGGLKPESRYFAAMQTLNAAKQGLAGGGADAIAEYARAAQLALPVAKDFLGPSERYGSLVSDVASTLRAAAPGGDLANLAPLIEAQTTGADRMTEALLATGGLTNDILARIQGDISRLNANLSAVMARMPAQLSAAA